MHSKVYLAPGRAAIIGSANISGQALSESEHSGQDEAAILETSKAVLEEIGAWFERLWTEPDTRQITGEDIKRAIRSWDEAQKNKKHSPKRKVSRKAPGPVLPLKLPQSIWRWAEEARGEELPGDPSWDEPIQMIRPEKITREDVDAIVDRLAKWTGHKGAYNNFRAQPLPKIRRGIALLFNENLILLGHKPNILW